jgi:hypothetical protein
MSAIAFGVPVQFAKAYVEGITSLEAADIRYAEQLGYRIKLLGITKRRREHGIELRVHPTLVPSQRLIANVEGAMNAVVVQGDAVGTTLYYGKGAGAEPTASAVIADLVDITRLATADPDHRVPHLAFQPGALQDTPILPMEEVITAFYLRLRVADEKGVLARITGILADNDISIDAVLQRAPAEGERQTDLIILTHDTVEGRMQAALARTSRRNVVPTRRWCWRFAGTFAGVCYEAIDLRRQRPVPEARERARRLQRAAVPAVPGAALRRGNHPDRFAAAAGPRLQRQRARLPAREVLHEGPGQAAAVAPAGTKPGRAEQALRDEMWPKRTCVGCARDAWRGAGLDGQPKVARLFDGGLILSATGWATGARCSTCCTTRSNTCRAQRQPRTGEHPAEP